MSTIKPSDSNTEFPIPPIPERRKRGRGREGIVGGVAKKVIVAKEGQRGYTNPPARENTLLPSRYDLCGRPRVVTPGSPETQRKIAKAQKVLDGQGLRGLRVVKVLNSESGEVLAGRVVGEMPASCTGSRCKGKKHVELVISKSPLRTVRVGGLTREQAVLDRLQKAGVPNVQQGKMPTTMQKEYFSGVSPFKHPGLPISHISHLAYQMLLTLEGLEKSGVVHGNIQLDSIAYSIGNTDRSVTGNLTLGGFSDAKYTGEKFQGEIGTYEYMAPEMSLDGVLTPASDMWSLGCFLFLAYTGEYLFEVTEEMEVSDRLEQMVDVIGLPSEEYAEQLIQGVQGNKKHEDSDEVARLVNFCEKDLKGKWQPRSEPLNKQEDTNTISTRILKAQKAKGDNGLLGVILADLIERMVTWDPEKRITLEEALQSHRFVDHWPAYIKKQKEKVSSDTPIRA